MTSVWAHRARCMSCMAASHHATCISFMFLGSPLQCRFIAWRCRSSCCNGCQLGQAIIMRAYRCSITCLTSAHEWWLKGAQLFALLRVILSIIYHRHLFHHRGPFQLRGGVAFSPLEISSDRIIFFTYNYVSVRQGEDIHPFRHWREWVNESNPSCSYLTLLQNVSFNNICTYIGANGVAKAYAHAHARTLTPAVYKHMFVAMVFYSACIWH